jgi:glutamine amidotransferase
MVIIGEMITIIDYQMGNLRSVQKGIERVGGEAIITSDPHQIASAEKLILPGVGAFGDAMRELQNRDFVSPIRDFLASGRPFLGICLGFQLLFERGFEHGEHEGLGIFAGDCVRFPLSALKVPHMGWNRISIVKSSAVIQNITDGSYFYFVHSYYVRPTDPAIIAMECDYGFKFCAMVQQSNIYATQFHPEKSQRDGLTLLTGFVQLPTATLAQ